jgi:predicted transcriptional regulator
MTSLQPDTLISLLGLPDHLRKTLIVAEIQGQVTAQDVAEQTRRARAVESAYLNQLAIMGFLEKTRTQTPRKYQSRSVVYFVSKTKLKTEVESLYQKLKNMPNQLRQMICEDMLTAFENRVKVFSNLRKDN